MKNVEQLAMSILSDDDWFMIYFIINLFQDLMSSNTVLKTESQQFSFDVQNRLGGGAFGNVYKG